VNTYTASFRRFASSTNGATSISSREPISPEQLRRLAPSVFAESRHSSRSERYAYIPTSAVLERLDRAGFKPFSVMQGGSRDEEKRGFTKHLLRLRHIAAPLTVGQSHPEIVLINSHDGTSAYRLMAGLFRLVCGNGMVVAQSLIEDVRIPHKGDVAGAVLDGCIEIMDRLPTVTASVSAMERLTLTSGEQLAFANAALVARYGDDEPPIKADRLLTTRRAADAAPTLWNTLNTVQENTIRGGLGYVQHDANGRRAAFRRTREIRGIDQNTHVNRALWALAEEMRKLKGAA